ncbi:MAG: HAD family hydrolase [Leptospiraceae bacterium]|nr:HAD family hydrolase [Leptospiraceae bacterium]
MKPLSNIKAILWDIDGTLFSSEEMIHRIYHKVFTEYQAQFGWPDQIPDHDSIVGQIGQPVKTIFQNLVPQLEESQRDRLSLGILHMLVREITFGAGHFYPGVGSVLATLRSRGFRFAAASNGRYPYIEAILRACGCIQYFDSLLCVDNTSIYNKNELVARILRDLELAPGQVVLIGDRSSDRDAARLNDTAFVACTFGHGNDQEWQGANARIDSLTALLDLLPGPPHS